jgi:Family of unknown function (DUF5681)
MAGSRRDSSQADHLKPFRFQPGKSGNPSGQRKHKPISDRYEHFAEAKLPEDVRLLLKLAPGSTYADAAALQQFRSAIKGDTSAIREIREAIEGKAISTIVGDESLPPVKIDISAIPRKRERA